ncbi:MinD/ParA family protein, partial [Gordonia rubripertincta]|nr:MinD/ParA family protein [Gordonia rubripertincta]
MTYENSTTPDGAEAPAPPPWLQFAPPPQEPAPAPEPPSAARTPTNDGRQTDLPPTPGHAPSNRVPSPHPDAPRPPEEAAADPVGPGPETWTHGPADPAGRQTPPPPEP